MIWIIIIAVVLVILYKFFSALNKDNHDLESQSLASKFQVIVNMLNEAAYNGRGQITVLDMRSFNLYHDGQNQIINFQYGTGHLTITWKYKYFQKELVHQHQFRDVRNLSIFEQQRMADWFIKEMVTKVENHKNLVLKDSPIMQEVARDISSMGLKSKNYQKWNETINDDDISERFREIIKQFLQPDDIDFEKFIDNQRANDGITEFGNFETLEMVSQKQIKCSPSFRHERVKDRMNRGMGIPDWFYIGYPDVAIWIQLNIKRFERELEEREHEFATPNGPTDKFFRFMIDKYLDEQGQLECAV